MPLVRITGSQDMDKEKKLKIMQTITQKVSEITGKPKKYILIVFEQACDMLLGGSEEKSLFLEVKSIGALDPERTNRISRELCDFLSSETGVGSDRINIEFRDVESAMWGWNGKTFG